MGFHNMGYSDFRSEIEKFGAGSLKSVSVRIDEDYAEFLNDVSSLVGMTRQPFMSAIIDNYAVDAIVDYLFGYNTHCADDDIIGTFFDRFPDNEQSKKFRFLVEKEVAKYKLCNKIINAYEGEDKDEYFKKYELRPILDLHSEVAVNSTENEDDSFREKGCKTSTFSIK